MSTEEKGREENTEREDHYRFPLFFLSLLDSLLCSVFCVVIKDSKKENVIYEAITRTETQQWPAMCPTPTPNPQPPTPTFLRLSPLSRFANAPIVFIHWFKWVYWLLLCSKIKPCPFTKGIFNRACIGVIISSGDLVQSVTRKSQKVVKMQFCFNSDFTISGFTWIP